MWLMLKRDVTLGKVQVHFVTRDLCLPEVVGIPAHDAAHTVVKLTLVDTIPVEINKWKTKINFQKNELRFELYTEEISDDSCSLG